MKFHLTKDKESKNPRIRIRGISLIVCGMRKIAQTKNKLGF